MLNDLKISKMLNLLAAIFLIVLTLNVQAYSYSEAGKEPLIEGREALIGAMLANDSSLALSTLTFMNSDLSLLETSMSVDLVSPLTLAVKENKRSVVIKLLNKAFAAEIKRRISMAGNNINDYQKSKILVAKSQRFLNSLVVELDDDDAEQAEQSIKRCLKALGNPGVFGAGKVEASPEQFQKAQQALFESLKQFETIK